MTWIRDRILRELPAYFDKDPHAAPGISLVYDGVATVTILRRQLLTRTQGGIGGDIALDLTGKSLTQLATEINAYAGYQATVLSEDGTLPAIGLYEIIDKPLPAVSTVVAGAGEAPAGSAPAGASSVIPAATSTTATSQLDRFTSPLWHLIVPVSWMLADGVDLQENAARQSLSVWSAEGKWLEYWGELYGNVPRRADEADRVFAGRIIREVLRPRLNALALEQIIEDEYTGVSARITNLHTQAWEVGATRLGRLVGRKYSRTTFEVLVSDLVDGVRELIVRSHAAGTLPYYRYQISMGEPEEEDASVTVDLRAVADMQARVAWICGRDRCGELPLFGQGGTVVEYITFAPFSEQYFRVTGATGDPFVLGTETLGSGALGDVSMTGVLLADDVGVYEEF